MKIVMNLWLSTINNVAVCHTEKDYKQLITVLDSLIDEVGENEDHPLASLMEAIAISIESYEDRHVPELIVDP